MPRNDLIQYRRGTAAQWLAVEPILAAGEVGYSIDANEVRIGDGARAWSALAPIGGAVSEAEVAQAVAAYLAEHPVEIDLSDYVQTDDARLADARTPLAHTQAISTITGLQDALGEKVDAAGLGTAAAADVGDFATAAQGAAADAAVQVGDLAAVATSGSYGDLEGVPSIPDPEGFATAAQGAKADTATQPGDLEGYATTAALDAGLSDKIDADDPRLSDARTPTAHTHAISQVTGLQNALDAKADFDDIPDSPADIGAATSAQGAKADTAVQPDTLRLPIVLTQAAYDGITPVAGQVYIIQG